MNDSTNKTKRLTYAVDPTRLNSGTWCHTANRMLAVGDIAASYSADRIGEGRPIRGTFAWLGANWVCIGVDPVFETAG